MDAQGRPTLDADRLADVLDGVPVLLYVQDREGRITYANRAACGLVGKPPEQVAGRMPAELFDPVTVERWAEQNRQVLETGRSIDVEDGWDGRTHLTHKTPVFDTTGTPVAVIGISTDITDRKRWEDELRRSERLLTEAQQIAGVGSWHIDAVAGELTWSPELCRLMGVGPDETPRLVDALQYVHEDDHERAVAARNAALAGEAMAFDVRIVRRDGAIRIHHCRGGATLGRDGPLRLDGTCEDVTDRRRAELHLAEAQHLAQLGSWDFDIARGEASWSPEMYRIYGEDAERFVPTRAALAERIVDEDRGPITEQIRDAIDRGGEFDAFARLRRPDGEVREVRFRGSMVAVPGSGSGHLLGICQDLTDIRRAEAARAEAVERFRSVFERAPVGMALITRDGRFSLANEAMGEFLGRPADTLLDCTVADITHPDDLAASGEALGQMVAGELAEWNTENRYLRRTGEVRWGALRALLLHDADGEARHCLALIRDITEHRLAERRRAALHGVASIMAGGQPLGDALAAVVDTVVRELEWERGTLWVLDAQGELQYGTASPLGSARPNPPELPAAPLAGDGRVVIPVAGAAGVLGLLEFACEGTVRLDDELADFAETLGGQVAEFLVRKRAEELVLHQALHDPLTGLPNRVLFFDRLDHAIRRLQREHAPLAVLFLDFDRFKEVNDRFGHAVGDEVLCRAAERVASALRAEDTVGRFGGDELVVLSEHVAGRAGGAHIAERILEQLSSPIGVQGAEVLLSASIGVCVSPVEGATRDALLYAADTAMYEAKVAGPGRYVIAE
ncbi:MAG TPA: PAS domain S-box protein [Solirubrobacteraceae bacterium]|nr:PAS domain S-box protein [Solirubrobacteraceae bacterium]